jgi:hypothetical protein
VEALARLEQKRAKRIAKYLREVDPLGADAVRRDDDDDGDGAASVEPQG